jgi:hypothetical protein
VLGRKAAVGRGSFALASFVAAVPAGLLTFLLVMAFLNHVGNMTTVPMVLAGATLAISAFVTLMPAGLFVFGGPKKQKAAPSKAAKAGAKGETSSEPSVAATSGAAETIKSDTEPPSAAVEKELEDTTVFEAAMSNPEIELRDSDTFGSDEIEQLPEIADEIVLEDEDDEDEPKRKRKKR